jgi:hypothetical protein
MPSHAASKGQAIRERAAVVAAPHMLAAASVDQTNGTSLGVNTWYEMICVCDWRVFRGEYPSMIILLVAG